MSSTKADLTDEQKEAITQAEAVVADPDSTEEEKAEAESVLEETQKEKKEVSEEDKAKAEEEELLADHKKQVFEGMVKGEVSKVANGEITLDQVNGEKLRAAVEEKLKAISQPKDENNADVIVQRAVEETTAKMLLEQAKNLLPEEKESEFVAEYEELKSKGFSAADSLDKAKKIHNVLSPEDLKRKDDLASMKAMTGGSTTDKPSGKYDPIEHEQFNAQQKEMGLKPASKEAFLKAKETVF